MTDTAAGTDWHCQAYGDNPHVWCFFDAFYACGSRRICEERLRIERLRIWDQLQQQRLVGDDMGSIAAEILSTISRPEQLLNADLAEAEARTDGEPHRSGD